MLTYTMNGIVYQINHLTGVATTVEVKNTYNPGMVNDRFLSENPRTIARN